MKTPRPKKTREQPKSATNVVPIGIRQQNEVTTVSREQLSAIAKFKRLPPSWQVRISHMIDSVTAELEPRRDAVVVPFRPKASL